MGIEVFHQETPMVGPNAADLWDILSGTGRRNGNVDIAKAVFRTPRSNSEGLDLPGNASKNKAPRHEWQWSMAVFVRRELGILGKYVSVFEF